MDTKGRRAMEGQAVIFVIACFVLGLIFSGLHFKTGNPAWYLVGLAILTLSILL